MTRKKLKLAYITTDSSRKATFKKRKKGILKKVSELSTLCGIDVCAIIYSPYDPQPEVWPSPLGAQRIITQFKKMPEMEQSKKMMNQEIFLRQRISKGSEQLRKQRKENREMEMSRVMFRCLIGDGFQGLNLFDLKDLIWLIDQYLKDIKRKMEAGNKEVRNNNNDNDSTDTVNNDKNKKKYVNGRGSIAPEQNVEQQKQQGFDQEVTNKQEVNHVVQKQPWLMELLNSSSTSQDHNIRFGAYDDDMLLEEGSHNFLWSSAFNSP